MMQPLWQTERQSLKKIKHRITIWSSNSTSGYKPKSTETRVSRSHCTPMFIISNRWRRPECPTDRWTKCDINTQQSIAQPQKGMKFWHMPPHAWTQRHYAKWNKLDTKIPHSLRWGPRIVKFIETESRTSGYLGLGRQDRELVFKGCQICLRQWKSSGDGQW